MSKMADRLRVKRIYRAARNSDGKRVLVDRMWPRGMSKARARLDAWMKEIAPSNELRKWVHEDPERWPEFRERYYRELDENAAGIHQLVDWMQEGPVTLLFASADCEQNNAIVLKEYLQEKASD